MHFAICRQRIEHLVGSLGIEFKNNILEGKIDFHCVSIQGSTRKQNEFASGQLRNAKSIPIYL